MAKEVRLFESLGRIVLLEGAISRSEWPDARSFGKTTTVPMEAPDFRELASAGDRNTRWRIRHHIALIAFLLSRLHLGSTALLIS